MLNARCFYLWAVTAIFIAACTDAAFCGENWIRPIVSPASLAWADSIDKAVNTRAQQSAPRKSPWISVAAGKVPVIITAAHATAPSREGKQRFYDKGTAALALLLQKEAGATVLYTSWASPCDANNTDTCAFKDTLAALIGRVKPALVLDIHSSAAARPYDVDFGTLKGGSIKNQPEVIANLSEVLRAHGLTSLSRDYFSAMQQQTITRYVASLGVPCVQLEINATWLRPGGTDISKQRFMQVSNALATFILSLAQDSSAKKGTSRESPFPSGELNENQPEKTGENIR